MIQKNGRLQHSAGRIRTGMILFTAIAIAFLTMSSASLAQVSDYTISPENPQPGDTVVISGEADSNEEVTFYISFEDLTAVSGTTYLYELNGINIPEGSEHFGVTAKNVDDLDIKIKIPYTGIYVPILDKYITVNNGVASFGTGKITTYGSYHIILSGTTPEDEVTISFAARGIMTADSTGHFEFSYDTDGMPEGEYTIKIGGIEKQITLGGDSAVTSSSGRKGSSNTGTEFKIVPADSLGEDDDGAGEDTVTESDGSLASTQDSVESTDDAEYVEGSKMEQQTPTESTFPDIKIIGVLIAAFGLIALGGVMYRKKSQ